MTILVLHVSDENVKRFLDHPGVYACYSLRPSTGYSLRGLSFDNCVCTQAAASLLDNAPATDDEGYMDRQWATKLRDTAQKCCASSLGSVTVEE